MPARYIPIVIVKGASWVPARCIPKVIARNYIGASWVPDICIPEVITKVPAGCQPDTSPILGHFYFKVPAGPWCQPLILFLKIGLSDLKNDFSDPNNVIEDLTYGQNG